MHLRAALLLAALAAPALAAQGAHAASWVPEGLPAGFYDAAGTYQVIGVARSPADAPAEPHLVLAVRDGGRVFERGVAPGAVMPGGEVPFRVAFPEVSGPAPSPYLASESHAAAPGAAAGRLRVEYGASLSALPGGGVAGRVVNAGPAPASAGLVLAVAHGPGGEALDVAAARLPAGPLAPGEAAPFEMRPDPSVAHLVRHYSCFAIGDPAVITINARRGGEAFPVRYESGILFAYPEFDASGTELSLFVSPGWPGQTAASFEIPMRSAHEEIDVSFEGEPVGHVQSVGEMGNWHVSFSVAEQSQGTLTISGLDPSPLVPGWVREAAARWAAGGPGGAFDAGLASLAARGLLPEGAGGELPAPEWARAPAGWWAAGLVSDREFLDAMRHLLRPAA